MKVIGHIRTDFPSKFGIPRQSGLIDGLKGKIILEPEYRNPQVYKGIEEFSHIWLLWEFSEAKKEHWSATVKPPRLGGKKRMGVFATRAPFRPNNIGLSCVKLDRVEQDEKDGPVLWVAGVDLLDGTPIYDIKPYIPLTDCHPEASEGYTRETKIHELKVEFPEELLNQYPEEKRQAVLGILAQDPRPTYFQDPERVYGVPFAGFDVKFRGKTGMRIGEGTEVFARPTNILIDTTRPWLIEIGRNVQLTAGVKILTHGYDWAVLKAKYGDIYGSAGKVTIGDDCFIGMNALILKGTTIGDRVIVGAGSVVAGGTFPSDCVIAGNPARVICTLEAYRAKRAAAQLAEAKQLVTEYQAVYGRAPDKSVLSEFFWLFEERGPLQVPAFESQMRNMRNYEASMERYLHTKSLFNGYSAFLDYCFSNKEEQSDA